MLGFKDRWKPRQILDNESANYVYKRKPLSFTVRSTITARKLTGGFYVCKVIQLIIWIDNCAL